jgi:nitrate/nitrite transport system ATP-binding protein
MNPSVADIVGSPAATVSREPALIDVRGVSKGFARGGAPRRVLADVNLSVARGEFVSIVGAMGSGKSTLLGMLAGLERPDYGTIAIDGQPVRGVRPDAACVFQNYSLLPWLTALDNVGLAVEAASPGLSRRERLARAAAVLQQVGLAGALHRRPGQLSGGMRQRVAIARAFATEPAILFLDEPFGALDALTRGSLQHELATLCAAADRPVTTIMITNNVDEAMLLSDRIIPLTGGPPATLGPAVAVDLKRPRIATALAHDREAVLARARVIEQLTGSVRRPAAGSNVGQRTAAAVAERC